jgi:hypothetical protein
MNFRHINIAEQPEELWRFFQDVRDEPVIVELHGQPLCVLYPFARLTYQPEGPLQQACGAWDLPPEVAQALSENRS